MSDAKSKGKCILRSTLMLEWKSYRVKRNTQTKHSVKRRKDKHAKKEAPSAPTNTAILNTERALVEIELTWARTWALSLKSQKIRTSYEVGWMERN